MTDGPVVKMTVLFVEVKTAVVGVVAIGRRGTGFCGVNDALRV